MRGKSKNETKTEVLLLRIEPSTHEMLKELAKQKHESKSWIVRDLINYAFTVKRIGVS